MSGTVYLVGAGPGDPRLITLRGAEVLRRADVVVYDRLAPPALLDLAPARAERIDAGKAPGRAPLPQQAINRLLVEHARCGRCVVRLKGGDSFVFGRGGEEALACAAAGIPFEVVPGVSAAVAAPAYAGIPVTHRGLAASFAVVTASRAGGATADLRRLARAADTLVVMMAAERLQEVCAALLDAGHPAAEPAALIQWASTSAQRSVAAPLGALPALAREAGIGPPATLVVGQVVTLAATLDWFTAGPRPMPPRRWERGRGRFPPPRGSAPADGWPQGRAAQAVDLATRSGADHGIQGTGSAGRGVTTIDRSWSPPPPGCGVAGLR